MHTPTTEAEARARAADMAQMREDGLLLREIAARYGITGERVRQVMAKHHPGMQKRKQLHETVARNPRWMEEVLHDGITPTAKRLGCSTDWVVRRFQIMSGGLSPIRYMQAELERLAPEAVRLRNAGAGWREIEAWYVEQLPWLAPHRRSNTPGHTTREMLSRWCRNQGVALRTTAGHDPQRQHRARALRDGGASWAEVRRLSGYGSTASAKQAVRKARQSAAATATAP